MADVDTEAPAEKQMLAGTEQIDRFHDFIGEYYLAKGGGCASFGG